MSHLRWINPVVERWLEEEYPGLLAKHGYFRWTGKDHNIPTCACGIELLTIHKSSWLLPHIASMVAKRIEAENTLTISVKKMVWLDAQGDVITEINGDGTMTIRKMTI